jgi:hypothetical protein
MLEVLHPFKRNARECHAVLMFTPAGHPSRSVRSTDRVQKCGYKVNQAVASAKELTQLSQLAR